MKTKNGGMPTRRVPRDEGKDAKHVSLREPKLTSAQIAAGAQNAKGGSGGSNIPRVEPIPE